MDKTQKIGMFKCRGIEDILHWTLMGIAFYFSWKFYSDMLFGLLLAGLVFELMKPSLFEIGLSNKKSLKGMIFIGLGSILIFLSLMATCSSLANSYYSIIADRTKQVETQEYKSQKGLEKNINSEIADLKKQLDEYPDLEQFQKGIPNNHSTNLTTTTANWQKGRQEIQDKLDTANNELKEVTKGYTKIKQFDEVQEKGNYKSYTKLFELVSKQTGINADYIAIFIFVLIAVLIELGIVTTKHIAVVTRQKRLGTYQPSFDERLKEYNNQILEYNFKNMMNQNNRTLYSVENGNVEVIPGTVQSSQYQLPGNVITDINNKSNTDKFLENMKKDSELAAEKETKIPELKVERMNEKDNSKKEIPIDEKEDPKEEEQTDHDFRTEEIEKINNYFDELKANNDKIVNFEEKKRKEQETSNKNDDEESIENAKDKENKEAQENRYKGKGLDLDNIKAYFNYLLDNSKDDKAIGYKRVGKNLGISEGEALRIFNFLRDNKYLKTKDRVTKLTTKRDVNSLDGIYEKLMKNNNSKKAMEG